MNRTTIIKRLTILLLPIIALILICNFLYNNTQYFYNKDLIRVKELITIGNYDKAIKICKHRKKYKHKKRENYNSFSNIYSELDFFLYDWSCEDLHSLEITYKYLQKNESLIWNELLQKYLKTTLHNINNKNISDKLLLHHYFNLRTFKSILHESNPQLSYYQTPKDIPRSDDLEIPNQTVFLSRLRNYKNNVNEETRHNMDSLIKLESYLINKLCISDSEVGIKFMNFIVDRKSRGYLIDNSIMTLSGSSSEKFVRYNNRYDNKFTLYDPTFLYMDTKDESEIYDYYISNNYAKCISELKYIIKTKEYKVDAGTKTYYLTHNNKPIPIKRIQYVMDVEIIDFISNRVVAKKTFRGSIPVYNEEHYVDSETSHTLHGEGPDERKIVVWLKKQL